MVARDETILHSSNFFLFLILVVPLVVKKRASKKNFLQWAMTGHKATKPTAWENSLSIFLKNLEDQSLLPNSWRKHLSTSYNYYVIYRHFLTPFENARSEANGNTQRGRSTRGR